MSAATTPRRTPAETAVRRTGARRERRHLRPINEEARGHPLVFFLLYVVVGVTAIMGAVSLNALAAGDAVEMVELESDVSQAERTYEQLVADVATLEDPARIRQMAEQMGMMRVQPRYLVPEQPLPIDQAKVDHDDPVKPVLSADR